ncbi:DUF2207 domain-containing protein [Spirosoma endbachense]|uniref:Uncharacterized protein n=1 Tax=Spirosoma endbachense TaxID=2666025 RepID=A0A6P1VUM5_9BACT|nr:DUF2207 domain-containing protein [Spirosoma endbachense]QHV96334.1 hypothetical protein GJR95_15480 [Spirosoma endbachense]
MKTNQKRDLFEEYEKMTPRQRLITILCFVSGFIFISAFVGWMVNDALTNGPFALIIVSLFVVLTIGILYLANKYESAQVPKLIEKGKPTQAEIEAYLKKSLKNNEGSN